MTLTFAETLHKGYHQTMDIVGDLIADEKSKFQHIRIFDTHSLGRVLVLDGVVQLTERDENSYSEMLSHLPILEHGQALRVMIVGGGDGAIAQEVLKHKTVKSVDLCDIDGRVIELCKEHFPKVHQGAFDDPRLHVHVADAFGFLRQPENTQRFDLIIADRPDPVGPAEVLFADAFYQSVNLALTERGVAVFQTGVPFFQPDELTQTHKQLDKAFNKHGVYLCVTPTYIGGFMAVTWGSRGTDLGTLDHRALKERFRHAEIKTDYYTPDLHKAAFALPAWIERLVGQ